MMNRTHNHNDASTLTHSEVSSKIAFHEAGHAAAIHRGNNRKGLPPVFFKIAIKPLNIEYEPAMYFDKPSIQYIAKVEGGRLIHSLPPSFHESTKKLSTIQKLAYLRAFEADMINLLVGPLAEARYIALRDNEAINPRLVNVDALKYYGGSSDLEIVNEYLDCFIVTQELRKRKMTELFMEAFSFVSERSNWLAIKALAHTILATDKNIIECGEIIAILESVDCS